jgi:CRISPR-associated endoribonuclease Cas6
MKGNKPLSIALEEISHRDAKLRVNFMDESGQAYILSLMQAIYEQPNLRLGDVNCIVSGVGHLVDRVIPSCCKLQTWNDLVNGSSKHCMFFNFMTPTAFNKCDEDGNRFTWLFPTTVELFTGLARRWRSLSGPSLPNSLEEYIFGGGCLVSSHELKTVKFNTKERTQIGFIGRVTYECRKNDPANINALNSLTRMSFFTGVGYQTARGMGAVRVGMADRS